MKEQSKQHHFLYLTFQKSSNGDSSENRTPKSLMSYWGEIKIGDQKRWVFFIFIFHIYIRGINICMISP